jgi:diguanylate cyclase (GGDEF)-like protein
MTLDLPTLMIMQSFVLASAGAILLFAWFQDRAIAVLAQWGIAHIIAAGGILSLMLGVTLHEPIWSVLGGGLLAFQSSLIWKAARNIDSKPVSLVFAVGGPIAVVLGGAAPFLREFPGSLTLAMGAIYSLATATSLWLGRNERLAARWPLIILSGVHGTSLLVGTYSTLVGSTGQEAVPSLASMFGFIYFEAIIFALGTSVFVLAFIKERIEAASVVAARTDSLTGIANRGTLLANAERLLQRCRRADAPVSVMMFDLDRFKAVNDGYGHAVGDAVILKFCEVAAAALRPTDLFGRIGGEEFVVILPGSSIEAACVRAERIRLAFAENCRFVRNDQVNATVSGGVAVTTNARETLEMLLEYADLALYNAKTGGRNRIMRADQPSTNGKTSNVFRVA